jgi:NADH-quinone oxidoreductase subunit G
LGAEAAYYLPRTPNGRGVSDAWSCAAEGEPVDEQPRLVVVSGDEAACDPGVRALASRAEAVIGIGMFEGSFRGLCDLVLPGTSYLERDGTTVNLEGRLQRQRRAVSAPCPDELAWIAKLAERFELTVSPHAAVVFAEVSAICFGGVTLASIGEHSPLPLRPSRLEQVARPRARTVASGTGLRLLRYRALFSGPIVERTPELEFQRPGAEIELSLVDARERAIGTGDEVTVSSNGTAVPLRARIARDLPAGSVRLADTVASDLYEFVEVVKR